MTTSFDVIVPLWIIVALLASILGFIVGRWGKKRGGL